MDLQQKKKRWTQQRLRKPKRKPKDGLATKEKNSKEKKKDGLNKG